MTKPSPRDHVLFHAFSVFMRFGYARANMQDIAAAAGLSRQGLYHHFSNKEELFAAMIEDGNAATIRAAETACAAARAAGKPFPVVMAETLNARLGVMHVQLGGSPEAHELVDQSLRQCQPILVRAADAFHVLLARIIQDEIDAGKIALVEGVTPADLAEAVSAIARGANGRLPQPSASELLPLYIRNVDWLLRGTTRPA